MSENNRNYYNKDNYYFYQLNIFQNNFLYL